MESCFFHIDVNSAFLSWTAVSRLLQGDSVDLRTVPAIIGGDQTKRHGIVLAKSIPAKKYHIETAEPVISAVRKCPSLIVAEPDFALYSSMSHKMMDYLRSLTPDIEQASIDECYLDFAPIAHLYDSPLQCANMIRETIYAQFGFTVNVGISDKKVLAKMASDFEKPNKTHTLYSTEIKEKMWPLPVGDLFLCGKSSQNALKKLDINTIGELATTDLSILTDNLKGIGKTLWEFANGIDNSGIVNEPPEAKGIGNSTTAETDITDRDAAINILRSLCDSVSARLKKHGFLAGQLSVEIKYATFKSVSHQGILDTPVYTSDALLNAAVPLFDSLWSREPIRLLGVRATKLVDENEPVQLSLFDMDFSNDSKNNAPIADTEKNRRLQDALSKIREKYGNDAVKRTTDI